MLRTLQKEPIETRMHVSFLFAFVSATVVAAFWIMSLPTKFTQIREANEEVAAARDAANEAERAQSSQEAASILSNFVASTTETYHNLSAQLQDISGTEGADEATPEQTASSTATSTGIIIREIP